MRTVRRVTPAGKVKGLSSGAEGKPSLNRANESAGVDPKPGDLSMSRLKLLQKAMEDRTHPLKRVGMRCG